MPGNVAIVLTGSIVPAVSPVAVSNITERRRQYLAALRFYSNFAPVYFLENSVYDLASDAEFSSLVNGRLQKFAMLPELNRGKGYQEFAMMDAWYDTETVRPERFLKITGRYLVKNIASLLYECHNASSQSILIDRLPRAGTAHTSIFSASWQRYGTILRGLYRQMDDSAGKWAEHAFYHALAGRPHVRIFAHEPDLKGVSGSTGTLLETPRWKWVAKQTLRHVNRMIDSRLLYLRG